MKKLSVLLIMASLIMTACGRKSVGFKDHALEGETIKYQSTKWYKNGDIFALRVYALGIDNPKSRGQAIATCQRALEVNAAAQIVSFFNGQRVDSAAGTNNAQLTGMANTAVSTGLVRHVRLHNIEVVKNSTDCTALAVVQKRGLKKMVDQGEFIKK